MKVFMEDYFRPTWAGRRRCFLHAYTRAGVPKTTNALESYNDAIKVFLKRKSPALNWCISQLFSHIGDIAAQRPQFTHLFSHEFFHVRKQKGKKARDKDGREYTRRVRYEQGRTCFEQAADLRKARTFYRVGQVWAVASGTMGTALTAAAAERAVASTHGRDYYIGENESVADYVGRLMSIRFLTPLGEDEIVDKYVRFGCSCGGYAKFAYCKHSIALTVLTFPDALMPAHFDLLATKRMRGGQTKMRKALEQAMRDHIIAYNNNEMEEDEGRRGDRTHEPQAKRRRSVAAYLEAGGTFGTCVGAEPPPQQQCQQQQQPWGALADIALPPAAPGM